LNTSFQLTVYSLQFIVFYVISMNLVWGADSSAPSYLVFLTGSMNRTFTSEAINL
ncbi:unnamed protein product, partial [marine sediment metagenome]